MAEASPRAGLPAVLAAAGLVVNIFSGVYGYLGIPVPVDRILFIGAIAAVAVAPPRTVPRLVGRPVHVVLLASVTWTACSAAVSGTLFGKGGLFALLDRVTMPALMFVLTPLLFPTPAARLMLVKAFTVLGLYLGLTSIVSMTGPTWAVFPSYIMDPSVGILFGRARGPFVEASANGAALIYCACIAAAACWVLGRWWRLVAGLTVTACTIGTLLTYTRSVWIGAVVGLLAYCLSHPRLRRLTPLIVGGASAATALAIAAVPDLQSSLALRFGTVRSIDDRTTTNAAALRAFDQHPLTGVGWNRFLSVVPDYVRQQDLVPLTNVMIEPHNVLLSRAAELGVPGALAWVLTMAAVFIPACRAAPSEPLLRQLRIALIALLPGYLAVSMLTPMANPFANIVPFVVAGLLLAQYQTRSGPDGPDVDLRVVDLTDAHVVR